MSMFGVSTTFITHCFSMTKNRRFATLLLISRLYGDDSSTALKDRGFLITLINITSLYKVKNMNKKLALYFTLNLFFSTVLLYPSQKPYATMVLTGNNADPILSKIFEIGNSIAINQVRFVNDEIIS